MGARGTRGLSVALRFWPFRVAIFTLTLHVDSDVCGVAGEDGLDQVDRGGPGWDTRLRPCRVSDGLLQELQQFRVPP